MRKRSLRDLSDAELRGRRALVRVDYNVPLGPDGSVQDASRVAATLPTLRHLVEKGARPVLLSHLGRPKGAPDPRYSLAPVGRVLAELLGTAVDFVGPADSETAEEASRRLPDGSVLLLENTRFLPGETKNDESLSSRFARLGELFVNDAFGTTHRAHASVVGVTRFLRPAVAGFLVEVELRALGALRVEVERPFVVAFGGAKISDKIELLEAFARRADAVLIGGAMANTFLAAGGAGMGASLVEDGALEAASGLAARWKGKLRLPTDFVVGDPSNAGVAAGVVSAGGVPPDLAALDIGPATREAYSEVVNGARTVFWNGPMGLFEREEFAGGTRAFARAVADATARGAFTVIGGGDSASAIHQAGLTEAVSHVSTGGGASLEYLARGRLPGVEALDEA
ncbi:MAG: phosphoglycerate kinase [Gemmatimonadota bacterium]